MLNDILIEAKNKLLNNGFAIIDAIYSTNEINEIGTVISKLDTSNPIFRKSEHLFAIRQFIKEVPEIKNILFNSQFKEVINTIGGEDYFVVKSIYFDKPKKSNWFVSYHQDLTISVNEKKNLNDFINWTKKHNQYAVQPNKEILENIFTVRIHLDDTTAGNGALKVINKSHLKSINRIENTDFKLEEEVICEVNSGGIMIMKPLLFHASSKTTNNKNRRVIHIEFSNKKLSENIAWSEYSTVFN